MTTVQDILTCLEHFAPYDLAEGWDNCGLMAGDRGQPVTRVLCALDVTEAVIQEAAATGAQLVVAHHPLIFTSVHSVTDDTATGRTLLQAIRRGISIICMHTNADCAPGGVNDALAGALGLQDIENLGAGGNGQLGRVGLLPAVMEIPAFAQYVKDSLHAGGVRYVCGKSAVRRVAVGGGACGKMMDFAIAKGADAFVIGDCSYDLMQRAESLGLTLLDAGHFPTENPVVKAFANVIQTRFHEVECFSSLRHKDCIHFV
ncbi:Nif3-like dinuclear metal center hexameric protein [Intestinibacillus massiliensis]|uniref:Nif3-like dinuclear metal center hexameric protein n=1 Tax=Intestinibacillus massiliensis TaxID=1871029 RepID=UPI000B35A1A3|nr:Nif3-like dinuclear metal center hexameric protein [Intestinibacillus massiliensis]